MPTEEEFQSVEAEIAKWVTELELEGKADKPLFGHGHRDPNDPTVTCKTYTARDIYNELKDRTKMGIEWATSFIDLRSRHEPPESDNICT